MRRRNYFDIIDPERSDESVESDFPEEEGTETNEEPPSTNKRLMRYCIEKSLTVLYAVGILWLILMIPFIIQLVV